MKAVFSLSDSSIGICQNPLVRSNVDLYIALLIWSVISSTKGNGYTSLLVIAFNFRKSMQNRGFPSFFVTNTTGAAHGLKLGLMTPLCSIVSNSFLMIN